MKLWILKAIVQKSISFLPYKTQINYMFQKYVTKAVYLSDEYFYDRLNNAKEHVQAYQYFSGRRFADICLEIGTGWYPTIPITNFLMGAQLTYSLDISFLTSKERIKTTIEKFIHAETSGTLEKMFEFDQSRMAQLKELYKNFDSYDLSGILKFIKLEYIIGDARELKLADNSIDFIHSNNTFEHIYPEILIPILAQFKRVLKQKTGIMSHHIDMSDHFANLDKTIGAYNFLKFSDLQWKFIDNSIQPQSRLRIDDYKKIYNDLNIPITKESSKIADLHNLKSITLAEKYKSKTDEINAVTSCFLVSVL